MEVTSTSPVGPSKTQYLNRLYAAADREPLHSLEETASASQASTVDTLSSVRMNGAGDKDSSQSSIESNLEEALELNIPSPSLERLTQDGTRWPQDASPSKAPDGVRAQEGNLRQGQKRTASGEVKSPTSGTTMPGPHLLSPDRARSATSPSHVNELSTQLRMRLSYAMLKVQNGWQSRKFEDLKDLKPRHGSSIDPGLDERAESSYKGHSAVDRDVRRLGLLQPAEMTTNTSGTLDSNGGPRLAPPADIEPTRGTPWLRRDGETVPPAASRRPQANGEPSSVSQSLGPTLRWWEQPTTPPSLLGKESPIPTSSDAATASERDAIETLLFMSSPGNSQHFRRSDTGLPDFSAGAVRHSHVSSRGAFLPKHGQLNGTRHVSFSPSKAAAAIRAADSKPLFSRPKDPLSNVSLRNDESIDMVLDQMPAGGVDDDSSSDESTGSFVEPSVRLQEI